MGIGGPLLIGTIHLSLNASQLNIDVGLAFARLQLIDEFGGRSPLHQTEALTVLLRHLPLARSNAAFGLHVTQRSTDGIDAPTLGGGKRAQIVEDVPRVYQALILLIRLIAGIDRRLTRNSGGNLSSVVLGHPPRRFGGHEVLIIGALIVIGDLDPGVGGSVQSLFDRRIRGVIDHQGTLRQRTDFVASGGISHIHTATGTDVSHSLCHEKSLL